MLDGIRSELSYRRAYKLSGFDNNEAWRLVNEALNFNPRHKNALKLRGTLGLIYDLTNTLSDLTTAAELFRNDSQATAEINANLGLYYNRIGDFQKAISFFDEAIRLNDRTDNPRLTLISYNNRTEAFVRLKLFDKAISDSNEVVRLSKPDSTDYYDAKCNLGLCLFALGKYDDALKMYNSVSKYEEYNYGPSLRAGRAKVYRKLENFEKAITDIKKALGMIPEEEPEQKAELLILQGDCQSELGRFEDAAVSFRSALKCSPSKDEVHCRLAVTLVKADQFEKAAKEFAQCKDPVFDNEQQSLIFKVHMGRCLYNLKRYSEAMRIFSSETNKVNPFSETDSSGSSSLLNESDIKSSTDELERILNLNILNKKEKVDLTNLLAEAYGNSGSEDLLVRQLSDIISENKNESRAFFRRGSVYRKQLKFKQAMTDLRRALDLCKGREETTMEIEVELNGCLAEYLSSFNVSVGESEDKIEYSRLLVERGKVYQLTGDYEKALDDFTEASSFPNPDSNFLTELAFKTAECYFELEKYPEVIQKASEVIGSGAITKEMLTLRGNALLRDERYEEARKDYFKALNFKDLPKTDVALIYCSIGHSYFLQGNYGAAIEAYDKSIANNEMAFESYEWRAKAKSRRESYQEAIDDLKKIIEFGEQCLGKKKLAEIHFEMGFALDNISKYKDAKSAYTCAINLDSENSVYYYNRGLLLLNQEKYKDALRDFNKAIALEKGDADYYFNRGRANDNLENYDDAIQDYSHCIRLKPDYAEAYFNRGRIHGFSFDFRMCISDMNKAGELGIEDAYEVIAKAERAERKMNE